VSLDLVSNCITTFRSGCYRYVAGRLTVSPCLVLWGFDYGYICSYNGSRKLDSQARASSLWEAGSARQTAVWFHSLVSDCAFPLEICNLEGRVLIIRDHRGNRQLIRERLQAEGLTVADSETGEDGLRVALRSIPQAILLSTSLPDMSGIELVRRLRQFNRTRHVFLMLIGDADDRKERLAGLEAGANDVAIHPIDPDLVMLRVRNAIQRANLENNTDPTTGIPAGRRIQDELMRLLKGARNGKATSWALLQFRIRHLDPFREVYGFVAGDDLLLGTARILAEALGRDDIVDDFLGYGGRDDFIVVTEERRADALIAEVSAQFELEVGNYYGSMARESGVVEYEGQTYPLASMHVSKILANDGPFYDIRSLSESLSESAG
jgi:DNA-binding response OmpR family regulator